jgi:hypothetical protein
LLTIEESQRIWSQAELRAHLLSMGLSEEDIGPSELSQSVKFMSEAGTLQSRREILELLKEYETQQAAVAAVRIEVELANGEIWGASGREARSIWETLTAAQALQLVRSGQQYKGPMLKRLRPDS